jgi:hypothetical protein
MRFVLNFPKIVVKRIRVKISELFMTDVNDRFTAAVKSLLTFSKVRKRFNQAFL